MAKVTRWFLGAAALALAVGFGPTSSPAARDQKKQEAEKTTWLLRRDFRVDGALEAPDQDPVSLTIGGGKVEGVYLDGKGGNGAPNDSTFSGEVLTARTTPILVLRQNQGHSDYLAVHTGVANGKGGYRGTWYDCSGAGGDFELVPKGK